MVGINNNNYTSQVPATFGNGYNNYQTNAPTQQPQTVNPFQGGDNYSVDNTSQAFDQAMARLTGQNVFAGQPQNTQAPQMSAQNTSAPQLPSGVSQSDMNWALSLEEKVKGGYTPTAQETQVYQNIAAKLSAAMSNPTSGNMQTQQSPQATPPMGVTQEELNWALAIENAVKGGYTPNQQETQAYQNIAAKMAAGSPQTSSVPQQPQQTNIPAGITQEEFNWAIAFENKLKQGYRPTNEETFAYQNINNKAAAAKTQASQQVQSTQQLPSGVSQQEIDWALQLENKVKGGYTPTQQETQAYQNIAAKLSAAQNQPQMQQSQVPSGVSQQEIDWALQLENKVKGGYTPTQQETDAYQGIANRMAAAQGQVQSQPSTQSQLPAGVSQQEVEWALQLEAKVKGGYTPTQQETQAYQALAQKMAVAQAPQQTQATGQLPAGVSQQEIDWALQLEAKVKGGYTPTQQETQTYQALAQKISGSNSQQSGATQVPQVTQQEIDWALALENKVKGGYNATPEETATYQNIAHKLQAQQQSGNNIQSNQQGGRDWQAWSQPFSVPRNLFETTPRIIQVPATLRKDSPSLPAYSVVNTGPSLGNTTTVPKTLPVGNKPVSSSNTQAPSKSEIDWALQLEDKVKKGYNPNEAELYQYKNIADRLSASQGNVTTQQQTPQQSQAPQQSPSAQKPSIMQKVSNAWSALTN